MSGSHHFYRDEYIASTTFGAGVNALCRAHIISTNHKPNIFYEENPVSMPYVGLTSFLPYPFKTSVFMRVSCPVFSCIFLNFQIFWYNKAKKWAKLRLYF